MGAVAWAMRATLRFPSPLVEPDVPISGIRLSDWLHRHPVNRSRSRSEISKLWSSRLAVDSAHTLPAAGS
jgi:hypothetical protein